MRPLDTLKRFILAKYDECATAEIREYVTENATELAEAFGQDVDAFRKAVAAYSSDDRYGQDSLPAALLQTIKNVAAKGRDTKAADRAAAAQLAATDIEHSAIWRTEACNVACAALLSCLTRRADLFVFIVGDVQIPIPMARLFDVRALRRSDLRAWLAADGLTFRWGTAGRLTFQPMSDADAAKERQHGAEIITIHLPSHLAIQVVAPIAKCAAPTAPPVVVSAPVAPPSIAARAPRAPRSPSVKRARVAVAYPSRDTKAPIVVATRWGDVHLYA